MPASNMQFTLISRPQGLPAEENFRLQTASVPALAEGQFLVRNHYASLDPAIRGWMDDVPSYMPPIALGDAVRATTVGEVMESRADGFKPGDWVMGLNRIEQYSISANDGFSHVIDAKAVPSVTNYLSVMGAVGLTAYFGIQEILQPKAGETLLISSAAGAVGSIAGQLGKQAGARVIGIAGGPEKCARLIDEFGFDAAIDHRGQSMDQMAAAIGAAAPDGIDMVFENVGGIGLDATLLHINRLARIALCGLISEYNSEPHGTRSLWQLIANSAKIEGFLVSDFLDHFPEGIAAMAELVAAGKLRFREDIAEGGIEQALPAFLKLFAGGNEGKLILKLS